MAPTVRDLILILQIFFPGELSMHKALYLLGIIISLYPLLCLHLNQWRQPRQPTRTAAVTTFTLPPSWATSRLSCIFCPANDLDIVPTLQRRKKDKTVWLLDDTFQWVQADLLIAHCASCHAEYYPDCITYKVSVWSDRKIAVFQENVLDRFHSGWSNFMDWLKKSTSSERILMYRQSQRLFIEHFSRCLLAFHGKGDDFSCPAHPNTRTFSELVRTAIGVNGGTLPAAMTHGCVECTHIKHYQSDLVNKGMVFREDLNVAGMAPVPAGEGQQEAPADGKPRGYVRLTAMDGKTLKHRKCALDMCEGPLVNYKDGRFCEAHLNMQNVCSIIPCGRPVHHPGALTCDNQSHIDWHWQYENQFSCMSFPGVQRVIRHQQGLVDENSSTGPTLRIDLGALGDIPRDQAVHTFRAKSTYCLQIVQWVCGFPIGWGKCYRSESSSQVVQILDNIWKEFPQSKPSFIAYDDACSLLRHIVTQDLNSPWLSTMKFIVDAWHCIGHRATDIPCRLWCNPAPSNGSQPNLIIVEDDAHGTTHQTRTFNTETAEQLNSWLNGFGAQLQQTSDVNYDFFIHVLMMIYGEHVEKRVENKKLGLSEEFWAEATGD
ncbi:hypothetical protein DFH07DRAFT_866010 [Mycena maculata]|uniref:CxC6 like cysteine cluster associated with KDZ domain-containing protein n=1 Tax=Mycena maculata TaxID=230809 RepID=A0AAD7NTB0_9AGAR|nr:hypothetical protein DFH07DRAFT_866010 [Mycena maculata]